MSQSLVKVVNILHCLSDGKNRFSDICKEVGLPPSTVHRLLESMVKTGLALQDPIHRLYYLGPEVFNLASNPFSAHDHAIAIVEEELKLLRSRTDETASLHVLMGAYKICLDEHVSGEPIKYMAGKGQIGLVTIGATGRALLSQLDDTEINKIREKLSLIDKMHKGKGNHSVFDQIATVRAQGFAESSGERQAGGRGISVPIQNYFSPLCISVMGPEERILKKRDKIITFLKEASERISKRFES